MTERRYRVLLLVCTAVALVLRLVWIRHANHEPQGLFDPARYLGYARSIADGRGMVEWTGHPTAYYPPGYPWFAGIVTWLTKPFISRPWTAILLTQAVIGSATVLFGARIARQLAGRMAGVFAAAALAIYPNLVFHSGVMLGETLFNALFLGFLALVLPPVRGDAHPKWLVPASGLLLGLAVMVRPISLAVLPFLVLAWWMRDRDLAAAVRGAGVILLAVAVCVVPWTIRNLIRMDSFVPISTNTGENLCIGNSPDADGAFTLSTRCDFGNVLESSQAEADIDGRKTRYALRQIVDEPQRQPWLVWRRFWFTWIRDGDHDGIIAAQSYNTDQWMDSGTRDTLIRVADLSYLIVVVGGAAGTVALIRRRRPTDVLVVGAMIAVATVPLAFFGDSRFKVPAIPLLIVIGAAGVLDLIGTRRYRFDERGRTDPTPPSIRSCRETPARRG